MGRQFEQICTGRNITTDFITATKKIHADVRSLLTTLHLIREDVKIIREQVVSPSDQQAPDQQTETSDQKEAKGISADSQILNVNQANSKKESSTQKAEPYLTEVKEGFKRQARKRPQNG